MPPNRARRSIRLRTADLQRDAANVNVGDRRPDPPDGDLLCRHVFKRRLTRLSGRRHGQQPFGRPVRNAGRGDFVFERARRSGAHDFGAQGQRQQIASVADEFMLTQHRLGAAENQAAQ